MIYSGRLLFDSWQGLCLYLGIVDIIRSPYTWIKIKRKGKYKGMQKTTKATIKKL